MTSVYFFLKKVTFFVLLPYLIHDLNLTILKPGVEVLALSPWSSGAWYGRLISAQVLKASLVKMVWTSLKKKTRQPAPINCIR